MKLSLFLILGFLTIISSLSSKDVERKILLGSFLPHKSELDANTQDKLQSSLISSFESRGFTVEQGKGIKEANMKTAQGNGSLYYIEGYYQRKKEKKILTVYALLYDPKTGNLVDVVRYSNDIADSLGESFKNIEDKYKEDEDKVIQNLAEAVSFSVLANPSKTEIRENIYDHLLSRPIGKEITVSVANEDKAQKAKEILKQFGDEEVITASRTSQKISDAPSKVYVFSRDTIHERGYRTLTELLQDVPGFDFNSFNDSGEYPTDLILRGISDVGQTQILLMENGIIQNDIGNGWLRHVQFDTVLIDVERIEIILGPGSALYGANAYAGLINIITRKGKSLFSKKDANVMGDARMQGGKNNTYMPEGLLAFKLPNDMIFQMAGRYYNTDGDRGKGRPDPGNFFNNNYEPDRVKTSEYGAINNDRTPFGTRKPIANGYNNSAQDYFLRGALSKDGLTLGFNIWDVKEGLSSYVPGYEYFANTSNIPFMKHHKGYFVNAAYETNITQKLFSTSKTYYRNTSIMPETGFEYTYQYQRVDFPVSNGQLTIPTFDKAKQYYAPSSMTGVQQVFNYNPTETNRLVIGIQLDKFTRQSSSDEVGGVSLGRQQNKNSNIVSSSFPSGNPSVATVFYSTTASGYIQDEQKFFNDKLSFTLGVRHDQDSDYGKIWTKRAAIIGKPIEWYNVKFLYGEAFKAPTVFQLYDSFRGNLSLQPQKIRTYEVENSFFINKMASLKAGYFISLLDGQIAEGKNPDPNATDARKTIFQNYKPTHIYGFTFEGDIAITNEIKLFGNYTVTRDRDVKTELNVQANGLGSVTSISPVYDGKEIDNIAERKGNLGVNFLFFKKLNVNLRMNWVGRRKAPVTNRYFQPYDPNFITKSYPYQTEGKPDGYMSGYNLLNATITYRDVWGIDGLELQVIGRNILNKAYMGLGRQSGNATRPIDSIQPSYVNSAGVGNPEGFVSPYHPQAGRELFLQVAYSF
ncbi:MAG TPA: TonB-dependent receptor plug domain-containing protein [Leptospiraceae bacterium]|nr:TonB-dependent receptor plug domain-containing protein [Leptospiraceae bacterium]HRG74212.1 TonB-dependent receptor plug domain-containing protein [Leptospiraceae bacterium]